MPTPAADRGREVRQRLTDAAVELIPERGWSAVSTRMLAERAGVTASVVHYHYPSLQALLTEAACGVLRQVLAEAADALEAASTPADGVDAMLASVEHFSGDDPASLLAVEAYLAASRDDELHRQVSGLVAELVRRLAGWLDERSVPAPEETAAVLAGAVDGLLLQRALGVHHDPAAVGAVLRRLVA